MNNRNHPRNSEDVSSRIKRVESESTRRSGQGSMGSSPGRGSQSDLDSNEQSGGRNSSGSSGIGDSSSGRH